ncbi:MAG: VWA domain-containing protein [Candidatus Omnitrophota bacterium]
MRFAESVWLYWLWTLVPLAVVLWWWLRRRHDRLREFADEPLLAYIADSVSRRKGRFKAAALWLSAAAMILALARPQWGFELREVRRKGVDILLAVDTSRSMLTRDVRPNRLARVKLAVRDLLTELRGDRAGLIAFAGSAFPVCPLTNDYNGFLLSLEDLSAETIPRGGTNISAAIDEALRIYEDVETPDRVLIVMTDGDNLEGDPLSAARKAAEKGMTIHCVGIGTREGELIRITRPDGSREFLKDQQGNVVKSRLNEALLKDIALATGGLYVRAAGARTGLDLIYERSLSKRQAREFESRMQKNYYERFQWPLTLAVLFLVLEMLTSRLRRQRKNIL